MGSNYLVSFNDNQQKIRKSERTNCDSKHWRNNHIKFNFFITFNLQRQKSLSKKRHDKKKDKKLYANRKLHHSKQEHIQQLKWNEAKIQIQWISLSYLEMKDSWLHRSCISLKVIKQTSFLWRFAILDKGKAWKEVHCKKQAKPNFISHAFADCSPEWRTFS